MRKGKKFRNRTKYAVKSKRRERILVRNQGTWFDNENRVPVGTHVKRWKRQGHFNKYGKAW